MERCYRHPKVETAVSCSDCGRPICPDCMEYGAVGIRCPECARGRGRQQVRTAATLTGHGGQAVATYVLLAVNIGVFIAQLASGAGTGTGVGRGLTSDGGLFGPALADHGEWWRIVTAGFLHAGAVHLLMNMFALYVLGNLLEPAIGARRFVGVYVVSLLAGSFGALLISPNALTVGASGAIYGILAAAFLIARHRGVSGVASEIGVWLVLNLVFTLSISGISVGGHLGGLAGGALAGAAIVLAERNPRRRPALVELVALSALSALAVAGSILVA